MAKKILSMLLALSMMLTVLAACNNEPVDNVENPDQQEEVQGNEAVSDVLTLVADGASDYVIVRGENAYISEVTATTELQKYIKQISGVEIPIVTDSTEPVEKEIVVGKTNREADGEFDREELGNDGLVIKTNGQKLFLVGGEQRGTLYAVYEFLESYLGCRFYTVDMEKVPEIKTITLEKIEEDKQIPVITSRAAYWKGFFDVTSNSAKLKLNGQMSSSLVLEEIGGFEVWAGSKGHTFDYLLPASVYLDEHPEYYNATYEKDGKGQPCMTNESVYEIMLQSVRSLLAENPDAKYVSVSQNDNTNYCKCDNCMAMVEKYGTYGGLNIWFVNRIAEAIKDEYPDVMIHTFAYRHTRHVPHDIMVADNVMVELCSIEQCFRHPLSECSEYSHEDFAEILIGWGKICKNVAIWDYTTNFHHYAMTFPNFEVLRQNIRLFADNNVKHLFEQGNNQSYSLEFGELRAYLISKLTWNPYMSEEEYNALMVEFLQDYYGAGWEKILEYINLALDSTENTCFGIYDTPEFLYGFEKYTKNENDTYPPELTADMLKNYETVDWTQFENWYKDYEAIPEIITDGERLWAEALELAETDIHKENVTRSAFQVEYIKNYYESASSHLGKGSIGKIISAYYNANPDAIPEDEQTTLRRDIIVYSNAQIDENNISRNKALAQKALDLGATYLRESRYLPDNIDVADFTLLPEDWIE